MKKKDNNGPKGKGKKALNRLDAIKRRIGKINTQLGLAKDTLSTTIAENALFGEQKKRSMINEAPKRIEFETNQLRFYIDFTIIPSESDDPSEVKGAIIYGTNRTLCFREYPFRNPTKKNSEECKQCERINRCDRLEDKPLVQFQVNEGGMIRSRGELEGEWWIKEKSDLADLTELHYRALDYIWKDALEWTNENILP